VVAETVLRRAPGAEHERARARSAGDERCDGAPAFALAATLDRSTANHVGHERSGLAGHRHTNAFALAGRPQPLAREHGPPGHVLPVKPDRLPRR
jgi:hypothetical protein